jgi:hypothetical protein
MLLILAHPPQLLSSAAVDTNAIEAVDAVWESLVAKALESKS